MYKYTVYILYTVTDISPTSILLVYVILQRLRSGTTIGTRPIV